MAKFLFQEGNTYGNRFKKGYTPWNKGGTSWNKGTKGAMKPNKTSFKKGEMPEGSILFEKGFTPWNKGKKYLQIRGANHHNWKGGITEQNHRIRTSLEYTLWRTAVFIRDNYICQNCEQRGGILHVDHIKPFSLYPELRFAIDNGRTLCVDCHKIKTSDDMSLINKERSISKWL